MTPVVELLRELVRIPSVNPDGDPGTDGVGEKRCAEFVAQFLRDCGAEVRLEEVLPDRPNVVARFPSATPCRPRLLLAPHTDTVSVAGMTIDPFGAEISNGRLWGRGASDTKGPMAAMLSALRECRDILPHLSHEIWFAGLMSEETGQFGAKALAAAEKFDFVIVGEPTKLEAVHTHKGSIWLDLHARGKAAHSSMPEKGDNAIMHMMDALDFLRSELTKIFATLEDKVLGRPTFNIGTINGGSKVNIVPESCEARVDIRTIPGLDLAPLLATLGEKFPKVEVAAKMAHPLRTDPAHPVMATLAECGAPAAGAPWFCDAAVFAAVGTPSIALGPGSIAQAHTADEWISIADLEAGAQFFEKFLTRLKVP